MPEYIECKALIEEIKSLSVTLSGKELFDNEAKCSVIKKIKEQPAIDVTEVVRCKECSFWDVVKTRKNVGVCTPPINDGRGGYCTRHGATYENDYCSFGRILKCPACGEKYNLYSMKDRSSCPNCGAKIDKEENL